MHVVLCKPGHMSVGREPPGWDRDAASPLLKQAYMPSAEICTVHVAPCLPEICQKLAKADPAWIIEQHPAINDHLFHRAVVPNGPMYALGMYLLSVARQLRNVSAHGDNHVSANAEQTCFSSNKSKLPIRPAELR